SGEEHIRHCMLLEFHRGSKATNAVRNINSSSIKETSIKVRTCQMWFARFREGDFSLKDKPRSGRSSIE
ncbi:Histone-lysine N-methyltransferase SETMAR, partial [Harpegnathos saltator]